MNMGVLATDNNQLIYIYSNNSIGGKKFLGYVESADKASRVICLNEETISQTVWLEISDMLQKPFSELFEDDSNNDTSSYVSTTG